MKKVKRKIVKIDENLCNGCGECIPSCPEQAIQIVDRANGPKARLVKEIYCDGLGACLGSCPTGALTIEVRESEAYNEEATIARVRETAPEMLERHIQHLKEHADELPAHHGHTMQKGVTSCPSARVLHWRGREEVAGEPALPHSELSQWPIQLHLVPATAPYFQNAELVIVADCVPFAYADFHRDFLKGKAVAVGCPKLDDAEAYIEKIAEIIRHGNPKSLQVLHMEVPCCFGLIHIVQEAMDQAGKSMPLEAVEISVKGTRKA